MKWYSCSYSIRPSACRGRVPAAPEHEHEHEHESSSKSGFLSWTFSNALWLMMNLPNRSSATSSCESSYPSSSQIKTSMTLPSRFRVEQIKAASRGSIDDVDAHAACGAFDHPRGLRYAARIQVGHLGLGDLFALGASHGCDLIAVWHAAALGNSCGLL